MKRRTWILSALGATGALVVGWGVMPARSRLGTPDMMLPTQGDVALNGWIKIAQDGSVVLAMPRSEMEPVPPAQPLPELKSCWPPLPTAELARSSSSMELAPLRRMSSCVITLMGAGDSASRRLIMEPVISTRSSLPEVSLVWVWACS